MTSSPDTQPLPAQRITGKARLAGVLGWPVGHSRSPLLHNYWLRRYGVDGAYVPLPVRPEAFAVAVRGLQAAGFRGANVTVPHKEAAFRLADVLDDSARPTGSVNTLIFQDDGMIRGLSTDGDGFVASLRAAGVDLPADSDAATGRRVLLLGAGGAARSVAVSLAAAGMDVCITNRTRARADELAASLPGLSVCPWEEWEDRLGDYALLVNTTSLGMEGGPEPGFCPALERASVGLVVADIVYVPRVTPLMAEAQRRGLRTVGGLGMLLHQARLGFHAWFGVEPQVDAQTEAYVLASFSS
ncbi:MAG: shikimate dehydrogenase [Acetobacter sp.]|uniref:shikimate dehydrogenase n=1 Tax=Acetobacter sp. TaxID=440 RepID=UPI003D07BACD